MVIVEDEFQAVMNGFGLLAGRRGSNSARSIGIVLVNQTKEVLYWDDSSVDHGKRSSAAPDEVAAGQIGTWALESSGIATGCEGSMDWKIGQGGPTVSLSYDNPYSGSNSYSQSVGDTKYTIRHEGGGGDNAEVKYVLSYA